MKFLLAHLFSCFGSCKFDENEVSFERSFYRDHWSVWRKVVPDFRWLQASGTANENCLFGHGFFSNFRWFSSNEFVSSNNFSACSAFFSGTLALEFSFQIYRDLKSSAYSFTMTKACTFVWLDAPWCISNTVYIFREDSFHKRAVLTSKFRKYTTGLSY